MRDPATLPRQNLSELYLGTQQPYRCPKCRLERIFIVPGRQEIPVCPTCNVEFIEDVADQALQYVISGDLYQEIDWTKDVCFLHTYTVEQSRQIIDSIPADSFHWKSISEHQIQYYAGILARGKWIPYGQYWHPVRFSTEGDIMTGVQRLMASSHAQLPIPCWTVDHSRKWFDCTSWVYSPDTTSLDAAEVQS